FDLRLRHPRPVYYEPPGTGDKGRGLPPYDPVFLMTSADAWNEDQPFSTDEAIPAYKGSGPDDPRRDTLDERRRGPVPPGVALEVAPPAEWYGPDDKRPARVRLAVIGEGWFLVGPDLDPARERLLLDTCNWLLARDAALPAGEHSWSYPRVEVAE